MRKIEITSTSPAATMSLGRKIGRKLEPGGVIAVIGELGCGKTLLTRGICNGLGVLARQVNSPTFVLVNEYQGRLPVFHLDMYQLSTPAEAVELGMMDYLMRACSGVMIIEWAERVAALLPNDVLKIEFNIMSPRKRRIFFSTESDKYTCLFKEIKD